MIAKLGDFTAAMVHPTMVKPAAPTNEATLKFLNNIDAKPSVGPTQSL